MNNTYPKNFKDLIRPIKKEIIIIVLLAFIGAISLLIAPISITVAINRYLSGNMNSFITWVIIAGVAVVFKQLLHILSLGYAHVVEMNFRYKLRKDFSDKLSRLPLGFFSEMSSGAIRKLISEDTIKIHTIIAHGFSEFTSGLTLPIACIAVMIYFEWHTALMILGITVVLIVISMFLMNSGAKGMEDINIRYENSQREMSHSVIEMVDGIKEIKNFLNCNCNLDFFANP